MSHDFLLINLSKRDSNSWISNFLQKSRHSESFIFRHLMIHKIKITWYLFIVVIFPGSQRSQREIKKKYIYIRRCTKEEARGVFLRTACSAKITGIVSSTNWQTVRISCRYERRSESEDKDEKKKEVSPAEGRLVQTPVNSGDILARLTETRSTSDRPT